MTPENPTPQFRFSWFTLPDNGSRRDYRRFQLCALGAIATGGLAVGCLVLSVSDLHPPLKEEDVSLAMTELGAIAEAGIDQDLVKVSGFLVAETALTMPDDPGEKVLGGHLKLIARDGSPSENARVEETLIDWSGMAEDIFLVDHPTEQRVKIAVALPLDQFPLIATAIEAKHRPKVMRDGDTSVLVAPQVIAYGGTEFSLDPVKWRKAENAFTELERRVLPLGQPVVMVVGVKDQRLVAPPGDRLQIFFGTAADLHGNGKKLRGLLGFFWIPLVGISFTLGQCALKFQDKFHQGVNGEVMDPVESP